ncbi:DUF1330 domain-containing protein [Actinoplanes sp. TRM 88003]|uniref:DUF1330 domain-containing protein n=1 Tax=Paractinoplanes aksuensis TaxID=2939490 RepID=A0ABT1E3G7_9ACTN|nr:DUF1330 domain-containing protein [Actinoplanes aksuensis]MCO8277683.1 DUF1330 domain-containing protein [Actinoplanes aksuensis]
MAVDPDREFLATFLADEPDHPVVMLNLLRFAPGGRELYRQYSTAFADKIAHRFGVQVVYAGDGREAIVAETGQQWDAVLLVAYPSRRALAEMVTDPEYVKISPLRSRSLSEAVLQPTRPWGRLLPPVQPEP